MAGGFESLKILTETLLGTSGGVRKEHTQEIALRRIHGVELQTVKGRNAGIIYLIADLKTVAIYTPEDKTDIWTGLMGMPVAGPQSVMDAILKPLAGQKFFVLMQGHPAGGMVFVYMSGYWMPESSQQEIPPEYQTYYSLQEYTPVNGVVNAVAGGKYLLTSGQINLPSPSYPLQGGETINVVSRNQFQVMANGSITFTDVDGYTKYQSSMTLAGGAVHEFVVVSGTWQLSSPQQVAEQYTNMFYQMQGMSSGVEGMYQGMMGMMSSASQMLNQMGEVASTIQASIAPGGTWAPSSGSFPDTSSVTTSVSYIAEDNGTVWGVTFAAGDTAVFNYSSGQWTRIPTSGKVTSINGKSGSVIELTPEDLGALSQQDSVSMGGQFLVEGWKNAPTKNDSYYFWTSANLNPSDFLNSNSVSWFTKSTVFSWDSPSDAVTSLNLMEGAFHGVADLALYQDGNPSDLVTVEVARDMFAQVPLLQRGVTHEGDLVAVGFKGLGSDAELVPQLPDYSIQSSGFNWTTGFVYGEDNLGQGFPQGTKFLGFTVTSPDSFAQLLLSADGDDSRIAAVMTDKVTGLTKVVEIPLIEGSATDVGITDFPHVDAATRVGRYRVHAQTPGLPVELEGELDVGVAYIGEGGVTLIQKFQPFSLDNPQLFFRSAKNGVFGNWVSTLLATSFGTAATRDVGTQAGNLMEVGAFGGPTGTQTFWHSGNFDPDNKANAEHTHDASDIDSGVLAIERIPVNAILDEIPGVGSLQPLTSSKNTDNAQTSEGHTHKIELNLAVEDIPELPASKVGSGAFDLDRIPDLPASKTTSGTFDIARIPDIPIEKIPGLSGAVIPETRAISTGAGLEGGGDLSANRTISLRPPQSVGNGSSNTADETGHSHQLSVAVSDVPDLPASKTTSGEFDVERIPALPASKVSSGVLDIARIPQLDSARMPYQIFSGVGAPPPELGSDGDIYLQHEV